MAEWERTIVHPVVDTSSACLQTAELPTSWYSSECFQVKQRLIRILFANKSLRDEISPRLESLRVPGAVEPELEFHVWGQGDTILLAQSTKVIAQEENPNAIRAILLQELVRCTEQNREWLGILHAGACGQNDSCVLLAGPSHSGKTTLCAALLASGLRFYCDDSAAIGKEDGRVSPMPFHMMVRKGSWEVLRSRFPEIISSSVSDRFGEKVRFLKPPAEQLAMSAGLAKALVFVSFSPGEKTSLRPLLPFETLLRLKESGFWIEHERTSISTFLDWLQSLPAFVLAYSALDEAVSEVRAIAGK